MSLIVTLMSPSTEGEAIQQLKIAWFAARRCRAETEHNTLWTEVEMQTPDQIGHKLWAVIKEDWALDLLRHTHFVFDVENFPAWAFAEMWRHQFIIRNVAIEQKSQRAVASFKWACENPFVGSDWAEAEDLIERIQTFQRKMNDKGYDYDTIRNFSLQGVLSSAVISMNVETLHHLVKMRGSKDLVGEFGGKAAIYFQNLIDQMWNISKDRVPWFFQELLYAPLAKRVRD